MKYLKYLLPLCLILLANGLFSQNYLLLQNGYLVDVNTGTIDSLSDVLILNEKILHIGSMDHLQLLESVDTIDLKQKWVIPGLIDSHVHLASQKDRFPLNLFLAFGVTSIFDLGADLEIIQDLTKENNQIGKASPRIYYCGPLLDQPPLKVGISMNIQSVESARNIVEMLVKEGCSCIKVYNHLPKDILKTILVTADSLDVPVTGHVPKKISIEEAVNLGLRHIQHATSSFQDLLDKTLLDSLESIPNIPLRFISLWENLDLGSTKFQHLLDQIKDKQLIYTPTLNIESLFIMGKIPFQDRDTNNFLLPDALFQDLTEEELPSIYYLADSLNFRAELAFEKVLNFVDSLHSRGVKIVAGTDGLWLGHLLPGIGLHQELKLLAQAGLSPLEIIQSATIQPAAAFNKENEIGEIAENHFADLLILKANPLEDIRNLQQIEIVIFNGMVWHPQALKLKN